MIKNCKDFFAYKPYISSVLLGLIFFVLGCLVPYVISKLSGEFYRWIADIFFIPVLPFLFMEFVIAVPAVMVTHAIYESPYPAWILSVTMILWKMLFYLLVSFLMLKKYVSHSKPENQGKFSLNSRLCLLAFLAFDLGLSHGVFATADL